MNSFWTTSTRAVTEMPRPVSVISASVCSSGWSDAGNARSFVLSDPVPTRTHGPAYGSPPAVGTVAVGRRARRVARPDAPPGGPAAGSEPRRVHAHRRHRHRTLGEEAQPACPTRPRGSARPTPRPTRRSTGWTSRERRADCPAMRLRPRWRRPEDGDGAARPTRWSRRWRREATGRARDHRRAHLPQHRGPAGRPLPRPPERENRTASQGDAGDQVEVELEVDTEPREVDGARRSRCRARAGRTGAAGVRAAGLQPPAAARPGGGRAPRRGSAASTRHWRCCAGASPAAPRSRGPPRPRSG